MINQNIYKNSEVYYNPESDKYIFRIYLAITDNVGKTTLETRDIEYPTTSDEIDYILSTNTKNLFNERNKKGKPWKTYLKGSTNKKLLSLI